MTAAQKLYRIKPLVWDDNQLASSINGYYRIYGIAGSRVGEYQWALDGQFLSEEYYGSIDAAKAAAETHYRERLLGAVQAVQE